MQLVNTCKKLFLLLVVVCLVIFLVTPPLGYFNVLYWEQKVIHAIHVDMQNPQIYLLTLQDGIQKLNSTVNTKSFRAEHFWHKSCFIISVLMSVLIFPAIYRNCSLIKCQTLLMHIFICMLKVGIWTTSQLRFLNFILIYVECLYLIWDSSVFSFVKV